MPEPSFASFADWTRRYAAAPTGEARKTLEAEGVTRARTRLQALADLITARPERALELAAPVTVREAMPASVQSLLEELVNAEGDYEVLCVLPGNGANPPRPAIFRSAKINGESFQIFTSGQGLEFLTHRAAPLNGIAVPVEAATVHPYHPTLKPAKLMALNPNPARLLEKAESQAWSGAQLSEPICTVTRRPWTTEGEPIALQFGGRTFPFSSPALAADWAEATIEAAGLTEPQPPAGLPIAGSTYTEGRKRFLLYRVDFPDYPGEVMSTNQALNLLSGLGDFHAKNSYNKFIVAPVGQGTDITPTMRLPLDSSNYRDLGKLLDASRTAAAAAGYDVSRYDFDFVCTAAKPAMGWAGLGWVGGVGFWLMNSYWDVRTCAHEHGHNLSFGHANWWNTDGRSSIGPGTSDEYGDDFDTMGGSGGGIHHFNSYFKNKVNWIPSIDCPTIDKSGVFRLHAQDIAEAPVGIRGLRLPRSGGDYWVEFRQLWTGNKAMMNGVALRWVGGGSTLLDMNPGSAQGKNDHPLTIGRTFTDPGLNYHITVLHKANTYPESVDVAVNLGPFPTNLPPRVLASAPQQAGIGQAITFTAAATDPNGDTLAYYWDFGDGDYSTDNSPVTSHSFGAAREYYAEVTVSDMRGGTARDSVLVRIGNPSTFTITGRVLDTNNLPVAGMRVSVNASRYAFTESDGTYTIAGLSAGTYTVTAVEPIQASGAFLQPFFENPVTVGPDFAGADFVRVKSLSEFYTPILPKLSKWKYLDDGSDQGAAWILPGFVDTGWSNGTAILGYGQGYENTEIRYGPDANNKYITYYFRTPCTATNLAAYANLLLEVLRDDGIVVYLNGTNVFQDNLAATGPVTCTNLALKAIEPDRYAYLVATLPSSALQSGTNVIAAEVHQADRTSSDLTFDLALSGFKAEAAARLNLVYISSPSAEQEFVDPTNINITAFAQCRGEPFTLVEFYADGLKLGEDGAAPFNWFWSNPGIGAHTLQVVARRGGLAITSAPVVISVLPAVVAPPPVGLTFIPTNAFWYYFCTNVGAPAGWQMPGFIEIGWPRGLAKLGFANDISTFNTVFYGGPSSARYPAAYFRYSFLARDPASVTNLTMTVQRDDGIVVYLNGIEILRNNISNGIPVTYSLLATNASDNGNTVFSYAISPANLVVGPNIMAAEVHQSSASSSDLVFALGLKGLAETNRLRGMWLTAPTNGTTVFLPAPVELSADVVAGGNRSVRRVEYFNDGLKIGESAARPYACSWSNAIAGLHELHAIATDNMGGSITSAPVSVTVVAPPLATALISFGDVWRYLDDGSNQGTNWVSPGFNDRAWLLGPAKLGYGGDGEITTVSFGPDPNRKYVSTFFRKSFLVPNPAAFDGLLLRLVRDDGAVVYLNGREIYRNNLLPVAVSFDSLALNALGAPEESAPVDVLLDTGSLAGGTNVIALEVHQAAVDSSDLGFDLALAGLNSANAAQGIYLTSPPDGTHYHAPAHVALSSYAVAAGDTIRLVEYFAGPAQVAQASAPPYAANWANSVSGTYAITAIATCESGLILTSAPITITIGAIPPPIAPVYETCIPALSDWRFWDNPAAVGTGWTEPAFDDAQWPRGVARFGWGYDGERTLLTEGRIAHYFRRWFTVSQPALYTELLFQLARDDGAVVYLNGRELFRSNMPAGPVTSNTLASATVNTPDETTYFETVIPTAGSGLVAGSNLVAVELHQASATSSDAGFDLQLIGSGTSEPRVYLSAPADGATFTLEDVVPLVAQVWPGADAAVAGVEFLVDNLLLGQTSDPPYTFLWSNLPSRTHLLQARATDTRGRVFLSEPITITVSLPLVTNTLIAARTRWKYLDNGSNQGTNWAQPSYNDSAWSSGLARLGYSPNREDGEATVVSYGPSSVNKYITTYFRREFVCPPGAIYTNLAFRLLRDDGAVVWLNGHELYRSNMDTNPAVISYANRALTTVGGADEQTYFDTSVPATWLVEGANLLGVEIHQSAPDSSDLGFDLELKVEGYLDDAGIVKLNADLADDQVLLTWPLAAQGYRVYSRTNLAGPAEDWWPMLLAPLQTNGWNLIVVPANPGMQFFRLGKP